MEDTTTPVVSVDDETQEPQEQQEEPNEQEKQKTHLDYSSMFIFPPNFIVRVWSTKLIQSKYWKTTIIILIILNCILLACWDPLDPDAEEKRNQTITYIDLGFLVIYTIELIITMFTLGVVIHPHSYFRDPWNYLDCAVVIIGWIAVGFTGVRGISTLRALRALRPLRLLSSIPSLRKIIDAMIVSIPYIVGAILLLFIFFIVYGILGVLLFNGAYRKHCIIGDDDDFNENITCSENSNWFGGYECLIGECKVTKENIDFGYFNFDNVFYAWIALFLVINVEGWTRWTYLLMDATSNWTAIYFVILIIIGQIFWLNLLLSIISTTMGSIPDDPPKKRKANIFTKIWAKFKQFMIRTRPPNIIYRACYKFIYHPVVETFLTIVIIINIIVLAMPFRHQPDSYTLTLTIIDLVCLIIFTIEMIIRLIGKGFWRYFKSILNIIDFIVVITGWIEVILAFVIDDVTAVSVVRVFRAIRFVQYFSFSFSFHGIKNIKNMKNIYRKLA